MYHVSTRSKHKKGIPREDSLCKKSHSLKGLKDARLMQKNGTIVKLRNTLGRYSSPTEQEENLTKMMDNSVPYSINKAKRWEMIDELKSIDNAMFLENVAFFDIVKKKRNVLKNLKKKMESMEKRVCYGTKDCQYKYKVKKNGRKGRHTVRKRVRAGTRTCPYCSNQVGNRKIKLGKSKGKLGKININTSEMRRILNDIEKIYFASNIYVVSNENKTAYKRKFIKKGRKRNKRRKRRKRNCLDEYKDKNWEEIVYEELNY